MTLLSKLAGAVSIATVGNLLGRAANVLIPFAIVAVFGADSHTDRFFFILTLAFFFFGTLANAVCDAGVPLLISGRLHLSRIHIVRVGLGCTLLIFCAAGTWQLLFQDVSWAYLTALAVLAGAGMANGMASALLLSRERFALPGATWLVRVIPLMLFLLCGATHESLAWLAVGIGLADWLRLGIMLGWSPGLFPSEPSSGPRGIFAAFPVYALVLTAAAVMGLNPVIDRLIAQISGPGAISILETAERAYGILGTLCTIGISSVLLTHLSKSAGQVPLRQHWRQILPLAAAMGALWLILGIILGRWGFGWYFERVAALTTTQCAQIRQTFWFYLAGSPAFVLMLMHIRQLQALQRWWPLVAAAGIGVAVNIPASLLLRAWMGVSGIALATSLMNYLVLIFLAVVLFGVVKPRQRHSK